MYSLKDYNTFGIDVTCPSLHEVNSEHHLIELLANKTSDEIIILGGGSNVLLINDLELPVYLNRINGIEVVDESEEELIVEVGGGENWHQFVCWCMNNNFGNFENLSLIPGTVGAAPMQNIGAYGEEISKYLINVSTVELKTLKKRVFSAEECELGYRNSVFKHREKGKYFITKVQFRLSKNRKVNLSYGAIESLLAARNILKPTIQDVSKVVIDIRNSKLPSPSEIGNAGSFFKNPIIDEKSFLELKNKRPDVVFYEMPNSQYKIPAGWLIDQLGWKGKRVGNTGCYAQQALVLVNYGGATGSEIYRHALTVQQDVYDSFGVEITPEVNLLGLS